MEAQSFYTRGSIIRYFWSTGHNCSRTTFWFGLICLIFLRKLGWGISCESSAWLKWNAKSQFLWKIMKSVLELRLVQICKPLSANHNCSRQHFDLFVGIFRENKTWHFMWRICLADNWHEMPSLILSEKKQNQFLNLVCYKSKNPWSANRNCNRYFDCIYLFVFKKMWVGSLCISSA